MRIAGMNSSLWSPDPSPLKGSLSFSKLVAGEVRVGKRRFAVVLCRLIDNFDRFRFGYEHYHDSDSYGSAPSSPARVCKKLEGFPALRLMLYAERGWNGRQGAFACKRSQTTTSQTTAGVQRLGGHLHDERTDDA